MILFTLVQFTVKRSLSIWFFYLLISFKHCKQFLEFVLFILGLNLENSKCKQKWHEHYTQQRIVSSEVHLQLEDWRSNLGWLLEMPYWCIINIENGTINFDQSRDHTPSRNKYKFTKIADMLKHDQPSVYGNASQPRIVHFRSQRIVRSDVTKNL